MRLVPLYLLLTVTLAGALACEAIANPSVGGGGSTADCSTCTSVSEIIDDYKANAMRAERKHVDQLYIFSGKVEGIQESLLQPIPIPGNVRPPLPEVRMKSDGKLLILRFSVDNDNEWVYEYSKGDTMVAGCWVTWLERFDGVTEQGTPRLEGCTERRQK